MDSFLKHSIPYFLEKVYITITNEHSIVISREMNTVNLKTIFVALFLAVISAHLIVFGHTLLDMLTQTKLKMPLTAYLFLGYLPMIISGIYIGLSRARQKVLIGACVGALFYFTSSLMRILIPIPYFHHSFRPLSFLLGLVRNGLVCSVATWLTYAVFKKRREEAN